MSQNLLFPGFEITKMKFWKNDFFLMRLNCTNFSHCTLGQWCPSRGDIPQKIPYRNIFVPWKLAMVVLLWCRIFSYSLISLYTYKWYFWQAGTRQHTRAYQIFVSRATFFCVAQQFLSPLKLTGNFSNLQKKLFLFISVKTDRFVSQFSLTGFLENVLVIFFAIFAIFPFLCFVFSDCIIS